MSTSSSAALAFCLPLAILGALGSASGLGVDFGAGLDFFAGGEASGSVAEGNAKSRVVSKTEGGSLGASGRAKVASKASYEIGSE